MDTQHIEAKVKEAQNKLEEALAELERLKQPSNVWRHTGKATHWYIGSGGELAFGEGNAGPLNSFPDESAAERMLRWLTVMDKMRIAANGHKWEFANKNYFIVQSHDYRGLAAACHKYQTGAGTIYFEDLHSAQNFIHSLTPEEQTTVGAGFPIY